jgi:hypothetical protein
VTVELTREGYLRLSAQVAARYFPSDAVIAVRRDGELWLMPLRGPANGGLLLKQRTPAGDRCVLVREVLADEIPAGSHPARWDDGHAVLRIPLPGITLPGITPPGIALPTPIAPATPAAGAQA